MGLVAEPQGNMFSKKIFWLGSALLLIGVQAQTPPIMEHAQAAQCCQEKTVGGVSYSLLPEAYHGSLPHQCLTGCVYTKTGISSSPKFCFGRGDLATECNDPVTVHVVVQSATTGHAVANASVNLYESGTGLDEMSYTNGEGIIYETIERTISNDAEQIFQGIFIAPTLNE